MEKVRFTIALVSWTLHHGGYVEVEAETTGLAFPEQPPLAVDVAFEKQGRRMDFQVVLSCHKEP